MKIDKDDIFGLIGTVLFHVVIFVILWFSVLKAIIPDEDGGVLVNFGNVDMASGVFEPKYTGQELPQETTTLPPPPPTPKVETPKEDLLTRIWRKVSPSMSKKRKRRRNGKRSRKRKDGTRNKKENGCANKKKRKTSALPRKDARRRRISAIKWLVRLA